MNETIEKAKHIPIERYTVTYPVGSDIMNVLGLVDLYIKTFRKHIILPEGTNINLWCRGSSGAIIAGLFASKLPKTLQSKVTIAHVKKKGEDSHSSTRYSVDNEYNIVIDDFVSTGETVETIVTHMKKCTGRAMADLLIVSTGGYRRLVDENLFKIIISND